MTSLRRGAKRSLEWEAKETYQNRWSNFQAASRRRESMRIKHQLMSSDSTPGGLESVLKSRLQLELSLVEGTAKFIMACKNKSQVLQAAKTLLVARERANMIKFELNKLRRGRASPEIKQGKPAYGAVSISDIRIPLMWKQKDHLQGLSDGRRWALFCVVRCGMQIYDTSLIEDVDQSSTDLVFTDVIQFNKMPPHFELNLEVYCFLQEKNASLGQGSLISTPQRLCKTLGKKVGKTVLQAIENHHHKECQDFERVGPKFTLVATTTFTLDDCSDHVRSHELYVESESYKLVPLFDHFCCRMAAKPYCCDEAVFTGPLMLLKNDKDNVGQEVWASLVNFKLCLWRDKALQEAARAPFVGIVVDRDTSIRDQESTLMVESCGERWCFMFSCKDLMHTWLVHLLQHASDHRKWKEASFGAMTVLSPTTVKEENRPKRLKRTLSRLVLAYNEAVND